MSELFDLLKFLLKVGFVESGRAIWWIGIGELLAFGFGVVLLFVVWRLTKRIFSESAWGVWCRRLLLITWVVLLTPVLASNGFFWGLNVATEKTIVAQQLIEHAFQESLAIPIDVGLKKLEDGDWIDGDTSEAESSEPVTNGFEDPELEGDDVTEGAEVDESPKQHSVEELIENLDSVEAGPLKQMVEKVAEEMEFDSSVIPDWVLTWIMHQALGFVKGKSGPSVADYLDATREIIRDASDNDEDQDGLITSRQLAWSFGATQGVPVLHVYMAHVRKAMVIFAGLQVLLIVGGATAVFWLAAYALDNGLASSSNETSGADTTSDGGGNPTPIE